MKRKFGFAVLGMVLGAATLAAQDAPDPDASTPPESGRGVARISLMNGDVSVKRGDSGDWVAAAINGAVMAGDQIYTGPNARAELQFDYYDRIRLAPDTEVRLTELDTNRYLMQVAKGTVTFGALKGGDAQVEVSTPAAALRPVAFGEYRMTVRPDGSVEITVRKGEAEIATPNGNQNLRPGRTMLVRRADSGESEFQFIAALPKDDWDEFNRNRDKELEQRTKVYRYVSRDVYGAEDLDGQGDWVYTPEYGNVWSPYVAPGWAPYRNGRWAWMDYYGWSWVSYDPWGWAPYHYGRWFWYGSRWCWYPGAIGPRYYWSPGIVAWFGWGGIGVGFGTWGWTPLAPFEPFHHWWGRGYYAGYRNGGFGNHFRMVNNYNVMNNYHNARVYNGVSVAGANDLSRGAMGRAWRSSDGSLERAGLAQGALPVSPGRESLRMADHDARALPRGGNTNQQFYSRSAMSSRTDRVPFEQQRQAIEQAGRRGGESFTGASRGASAPVGRSTAEATGQGWRSTTDARGAAAGNAAGSRTGGDWRSFGDPRTGGSAASRSADTGRSGWGAFGNPGGSRGSEAAGTAVSPSRSSGSMDRGTWSTGGGSRGSGAGGTAVSPSRSSGSMDRGTWSTGGGRGSTPSRTEVAPSRSGGGGTTGGGRTSRQDMSSNSGRWSTGGGASSAPSSYGYSSRSAPSYGGRSSVYSGGSSSGGWSSPSRSSAPSYSAPSRGSAPSYHAPSFGGSRGGGFSGGGRASSGGFSGGGGSRGGGGGGGGRSAGGRGR